MGRWLKQARSTRHIYLVNTTLDSKGHISAEVIMHVQELYKESLILATLQSCFFNQQCLRANVPCPCHWRCY